MEAIYKAKLVQKSNDELLYIVEKEWQNYEPQAVKAAMDLLAERGISFLSPDLSVQNVLSKRTGFAYIPFLLGIICITPMFLDKKFVFIAEHNIIWNLIARLPVLIWLYISMKRDKMRYRFIWLLIGLIFGGWTLIILSILMSFTSQDIVPTHDSGN